MDKKLIQLVVPALQQSYNVRVPTNLRIKSLAGVLSSGVTELSGGRYQQSKTPRLCRKFPVLLLQEQMTLADYDIQNGDALVLF